MFWVGLFVASIVYYFIWGIKKSSVRYTPNGNAYITDGSGYTYPGVSKKPKENQQTNSGEFVKSIVISFVIVILLYGLLGDVQDGLAGVEYLFFLEIWAVIGTMCYVVYRIRRKSSEEQKAYLSMPTASSYAQDFPSCKTSNGYRCNQCGSRSIRNWGVNGANDPDRVFICNHCGVRLYRN
jgi:hypothetical protein